MRAEANEVLGRYRLGECLATGGMAQVFAARSLEPGIFDRPIVVKRMLPRLAQSRRFVAMFVQEARLSSLLDHPNIIKVLDFEASDGGLFLVMEYVDGPDLLGLLKAAAYHRVRIPAPIATYICSHVLEALDYAHNLGRDGRPLHIVHSDISPSNVLLTRRGRVKLADFGIARASDRQESTATGTLEGKYGYMSPEQIVGAELDGRSDLFSVGIVLAELLMGRRLFSAPTDLELLMMVKGAVIDRLDQHGAHLDPGLRAILGRALAREPAARFATAAEFRDALVDWMLSFRRTGSHQLAALITALGFEGPDTAAWDTSDRTLSGDNTQAQRRAAASSAEVGRRIFATGGSAVTPEPPPVFDDLSLTPVSDIERVSVPDPTAALPALDKMCWIVEGARTGALTAVRGSDCKQVYFVDGQPDFVQSNVHHERFGEFLVSRQVLTRAELTRALAASPQFGGRLGETLVGLGLLRPIDAVTWLERQTRERLVDLAGWTSAHVYWEEGAIAGAAKIPLHLKSASILGDFIWRYPREPLRVWAHEHVLDTPRLVDQPSVAIADFGFDAALEMFLVSLDGSRPLSSLTNVVEDRRDRYAFLAALVILDRLSLLRFP